MIYDLWVVHKQRGVCIFHQMYGGKDLDADLFSGFLSGIYSFSEEISETGGIEIMELKDMKLLYGLVSELIFIIGATKDEQNENLRKKLSEISRAFVDKFADTFEDWNGEISIFDPFRRVLDQLLNQMSHLDFVDILVRLPQKKRLKLTDEEFQVLSLCDGENSSITIGEKLNLSEIQLIKILVTLEKNNLVRRKRRLPSAPYMKYD